ncbi:MAG: peptide chain release factor N(5)-glutamine methyltransferase [Desulfobacterota bacterium]|nr:peptide chain release factor N(5)-glutamine methyltransferase [Thermodesulfobacteriota bacterium]
MKVWTIGELLKVSADYLKQKGIDSPRLSAEILLAHQLRLTRVKLYLQYDQPLTEQEIEGYRALVRRRLSREPVQYITGTQEFWSMEFLVTPAVLIPRPETEVLLEQAVLLGKEDPRLQREGARLLDLGTGCGALAVALAREFEKALICATDLSAEALRVAMDNAERHGVKDRIEFKCGDWFSPFAGTDTRFDMILSNPPYVSSEAFESLSPEVRDHEPRSALDGREQGMQDINRILDEAAGYLVHEGWILMEMGPEQTPEAVRIIEETGQFAEHRRIQDYSRRYRTVMARKK